MLGRFLYTLVIVVAVLASAPATTSAQSSAADAAAARDLFGQGVRLSEEGDWEGAADRFRRSLALRESPVVAFNLGMALSHLGRLVEAIEHFRMCRNVGNAELEAAAEEQITQLEPQVGRLTIEVRGPTAGVRFALDGRPISSASLGVAIPADPGTRTLIAERDGEAVAEASADVTSGALSTLRIEVPPAPLPDPEITMPDPVSAPGPTAPVDGDGGDDAVAWGVGIGVGVAVLAAVAIVLAVVLTSGSPAQPIEGNLLPGVVEFGP
ncbi:MAG: tetratricopeptide repeat protein [Sandaracinaceae bacterium]